MQKQIHFLLQFAQANLVEGGGFEPPKLTQQIYSLPPLAARESLQMSAAF